MVRSIIRKVIDGMQSKRRKAEAATPAPVAPTVAVAVDSATDAQKPTTRRRREPRDPATHYEPSQSSQPRDESRPPRRRRRPAGDRPAGDRPASDRPAGDRPAGDRPTGDRPSGDRPAGDRPPRDRSSGDHRPRREQSEPADTTIYTPRPAPEKRQAHPDWNPSHFDVPPSSGLTRFHDLNLQDSLLHSIADLGFKYCTPIQAQILPHTLVGKDAFGKAQTGTGKTAAFLIAAFDHFLRNPLPEDRPNATPRALIIAPTRELVLQIARDAEELNTYTHLNVVAVYGGMDYEKQLRQLQGKPIDLVVATPGRLLDFMRRRDIHLRHVEILVLDEADRMLDMGFIPDVRTIVHATPNKTHRQTLFFSATLTPEITRLAAQWTREPVSIEIEPEQIAVDTVEQVIYIVTESEKFALLFNLLEHEQTFKAMVFVNRRDHAEGLCHKLAAHGIDCELLSGAVPQRKRLHVLDQFKAGAFPVLVATDVAGRGIHVDGISHVINFNMPEDPEDYVHRIGRTGRAGASGQSISFATESESFFIPGVEEFIKRSLPCVVPEESLVTEPPPPPGGYKPLPRRPRTPDRGGPRGGGRSGPPRGGSRGGSRPPRR